MWFRSPNRRVQTHQCHSQRFSRPKIRMAVTIQVLQSFKIHVSSRLIRNRITIRAQFSKRTTKIRAQTQFQHSNWHMLEFSQPLKTANHGKTLAGPRQISARWNHKVIELVNLKGKSLAVQISPCGTRPTRYRLL